MSLTLAEARHRAAVVSDVSYDVELDLAATTAERFGSRTTVRFTCAAPETFLELADARDLTVALDGRRVDPSYDGTRLRLTGLGGRHEVVVEASLAYRTDGEGMHRFVDPADGETYVGAYLGMDLAQRLFACFDQNDLKATFGVSVAADPAWTVLANGIAASSGPGRWTFTRTPPIPPALLVVAAGPWVSVAWEHRGLPFGWHARRSLADELERDATDLRRVTEQCFDHYAEIFTEPYPFDSYDQVFVPGLNWGAQEMPGCVTYRDEMLPRGRIGAHELSRRTAVIAHEMSHMWFGDLVTMTWWEDSWLQESFADYLGYRVAADAAGRPEALLIHEAGRKPAAYDADRRRSTHPVAPRPEDVPDVDAAATIFDAISYAKGNSVLRQLVTWLGDETFLRGVDRYLGRHRFGNATLGDFVACLDEVAEPDVARWAEVWLRRSGHDTLVVEREDDVPVLRRDGERPHRVRVSAYDEDWQPVGDRLVDLADDAPLDFPEWAGRIVLPDAGGETFAALALDAVTWERVAGGFSGLADPVARAVLWQTVAARVHRRLLDPPAYADLLARTLPGETQPVVVRAVLMRTLRRVLPLRVGADAAPGFVDRVARICEDGLDRARDPDVAAAFADGLAATTHDAGALAEWLAAGAVPAGRVGSVPLIPGLRWQLVQRLAELGALDEPGIAAEAARDRSAGGEAAADHALAARPTPAAKESAWTAAADPDVGNRRFGALMAGLWSVEQPDLVAPYVDRYLTDAPRWARRGQGFAQVVGQAFPAVALTDRQVADLETALKGDVPVVLRRFLEDAVDDLR